MRGRNSWGQVSHRLQLAYRVFDPSVTKPFLRGYPNGTNTYLQYVTLTRKLVKTEKCLSKIGIFTQRSKFLVKIEIFGQNRNFCQK